MELRDFAEQVLFATRLDEKLQRPQVITDARPGAPSSAPTAPGRPPELGFKPAGPGKGGFPGLHRLEKEQERGRTPNVFVFNPFTEGHIAHGTSFSPVKAQRLLSSDLANLPQFLCRQDDIVLLPKHPSVEFLSGVQQAGFCLPEFVELKGDRIDPASSLCQRELGTLRPWAWGPDSVALFEPLWPHLTGEIRSASQRFNAGIAELYSKAWSAAFLRRVLARWPGEGWLCTEAETGVAVDTLEAALEAIAALRHGGYPKVVVKQTHGLAGHNALRLWEPDLLETQRRWMAHAFEKGQRLVIEPWLERQLDFSLQLEMGAEGLKLCGYTGLINDHRGQFQANWAAAGHDQHLPGGLLGLLGGHHDAPSRCRRLYAEMASLLGADLQRTGYLGPVGLDAFVYRTPEGESRLKPIVEINPRYTMGRLTVELMKHACPASHGLLRLVTATRARTEGFSDLAAYARALQARFPLRLQGTPAPRIREGVVSLNDPACAQVCLAVFRVGRTLGELVGLGEAAPGASAHVTSAPVAASSLARTRQPAVTGRIQAQEGEERPAGRVAWPTDNNQT
jgi:hypothetical protein